MPLTNTLPLTLTGTLSGHPDAATGLVHLGGGRWYPSTTLRAGYPALGRPLQPNTAGGPPIRQAQGPPTLPQALNRYAATPLGQPGVYQAADSSPVLRLLESSRNQVPGLLAGPPTTAVALHLWAQTIYTTAPTGIGRIALEGSARKLTWNYLDEFISLERVSSRLADGFWGRPFSYIFRSARIRTMIGRAYIGSTADDFARFQARLGQRGITVNLLSHEFGEVVDAVATSASRSAAEKLGGALGVGVGGLINAGIQYAYDYDNPYLTGWQKAQRAGVSGGLGVIAGTAGLLIGGPVGVGVAFGLGVAFELGIAPRVFEFLGAIPVRDLAPLMP